MRVSIALQPGDLVFDTSGKLDRPKAAALRQYGGSSRVAVVRYVYYGPPRPSDIDKPELDGLLDEDLIVFLVQHPPGQPWAATGPLGAMRVAVAISQSQRAGYVTPNGQKPLSLSSDMEDIANRGGPPAAFQMEWRNGCRSSSYGPVGYVGFADGMTAAEMLLIEGCVWWCDGASLSQRPAVPYALKQQLKAVTIGGVEYDANEVLIGDRIYGLYEDGSDPVLPERVDPDVD